MSRTCVMKRTNEIAALALSVVAMPVFARILVSLAVLLTVSVAYADVITVTGVNVTLIPSTASSVSTGASGTSATGPTHTWLGTLGQFDPTLGVLTGAVATASVATGNPATDLIKGGGTGSATARSNWSLGGNSSGQVVINTAGAAGDAGWGSFTLTSSAGNLNNFVGAGNIATNGFASYITASRSSGGAVYGHPGISISSSGRRDLIYSESIAYTYSTHSDASFESAEDEDYLTLDFGLLAGGTSDDESFSIFNRGGLGLTNFTLSFLEGDDLFNVTGGNVAAGGSSLYNASFAGQNPLALTDYEGTYRLTFTDSVSGLAQHASNSIGTNYIDLRMTASVAPVPEPATMLTVASGLLAALGIQRRRRMN